MEVLTIPQAKTQQLATTSLVDTVIRNYKQERWVHNSERIGKEDSLSAWWSIEEMENFIEMAKSHGADGLKFYFGAFSDNHAKEPDYAERQTLVMVGTKETNTVKGVKNKDIYIQNGDGTNILANCNATLCPPRCSQPSPSPAPTENPFDIETLGLAVIDRGDKGILIF